MNDSFDTAEQAEQAGTTAAPESEQKHPIEGGSYVRYPETGEIEKVAGPKTEEQE